MTCKEMTFDFSDTDHQLNVFDPFLNIKTLA